MVFEKLREILADELELSEDEITMESDLVEDLGADSMAVVDLIMSIEDEFGVEVPDEDVEKVKTIGDAVRYIEAKIG
ncbi:MAG: acyl carrier protein [Clostridia bacterium]|jgi:acyl carrier protein|nr:acyl carrier protein [Clostridia bacterium]